jgi:hypothetical protein
VLRWTGDVGRLSPRRDEKIPNDEKKERLSRLNDPEIGWEPAIVGKPHSEQ